MKATGLHEPIPRPDDPDERLAVTQDGRSGAKLSRWGVWMRVPRSIRRFLTDRFGDVTKSEGWGYVALRYWNGRARSISSSRPASAGLRGLPGWITATWHASAASTISRKVPASGSLKVACMFSS